MQELRKIAHETFVLTANFGLDMETEYGLLGLGSGQSAWDLGWEINELIEKTKGELAPGEMTKAMVLNIIGGRDALYLVEDWARKVPLDLLIGPDARPEQFNDTSLARHLDRLHAAGGESVYTAASLRVLREENVDVSQLHADTTSRLVFGKYYDEEGAISITHGHSKDNQPQLRQTMYGLVVTSDGIPLIAQVLSGNTSDKTWLTGLLDVVNTMLKPHSDGALHCVGDSAMVTEATFDLADEHGIILTSRLPRNYSLADTAVISAVYGDNVDFADIGSFGAQKNASTYEGCVLRDVDFLERKVQLGVYRPTPANERTIKSVQRRRNKMMKDIGKEAKRVMKVAYDCAPDAAAALEKFIDEHVSAIHADRIVQVSGTVVSEEVEVKRVGRKPKGYIPKMTTQYRLAIELAEDEKNTEGAIARESCFVLVHTGKEEISAKEMMKVYKGQSVVETRFPFLKDPAWTDVFFVKTPHRVEALGYIMLLALLVWSVWQRRVRANLAASDEPHLLDCSTGIKNKNPTAMVCWRMLRHLRMVRTVEDGVPTPWRIAEGLLPEQALLLRFSERTQPS